MDSVGLHEQRLQIALCVTEQGVSMSDAVICCLQVNFTISFGHFIQIEGALCVQLLEPFALMKFSRSYEVSVTEWLATFCVSRSPVQTSCDGAFVDNPRVSLP